MQHSVHPSPFCWVGGGGVEPLTKFSKTGAGLAGSQFLEGVAGKEGVTFLRGGVQFLHKKNKLKSEIFNDKKSLKRKMFFSEIKLGNFTLEFSYF